MQWSTTSVPVVMVFGGSDPTGGAGIQADIETIASMACHAAPVVTSVTVQDTHDVHGFTPMEPDLVVEQARAVLDDMPVAAFKLGMMGSVPVVEAVHTLLAERTEIPVVVDPVLWAAGGAALSDEEAVEAIKTLLLPLATVLTPNRRELQALAPEGDSLGACSMSLLERGSELILATGGDSEGDEVHNVLYGNNRQLETFSYGRIEGSFHGSGCTLASAIAGLLAHGQEPFSAIHEAQEYTWQALKHGYQLGHGQRLPNRLFWASSAADRGGG